MARSIAGLLSGIFGSAAPYQAPAAEAEDPLAAKVKTVRALMDQVSGGKSANFLSQVDMARGATPGAADPRIAEALTTPADLAVADRVTWGKRLHETEPIPTGGLSLLPTVGYEGMKAVAQTPLGAGALKALGGLFTKAGGAQGSQLGDWFTIDKSSSPASMDNIRALIAGYYGK